VTRKGETDSRERERERERERDEKERDVREQKIFLRRRQTVSLV